MHSYLIELLECPACHGELDWSITERRDDRVHVGEARCKACRTSYPVREGMGLFLTPDLPREDLWQRVDSQLTRHLRQHPEVERQLMEVPLESLNPADQLFRALVLEERGHYVEARAAEDLAQAGLTPSGVVLDGAGIDALPVAEATLEWCVLVATAQAEYAECGPSWTTGESN